MLDSLGVYQYLKLIKNGKYTNLDPYLVTLFPELCSFFFFTIEICSSNRQKIRYICVSKFLSFRKLIKHSSISF